MKTSFATTALIIACGLSASSSFAAYSAPQNQLNNVATSSFFAPTAPSVLSRSEVKAQKPAALVTMGEGSAANLASTPSSLSRAEVKADARQAQQIGTLRGVDYRG